MICEDVWHNAGEYALQQAQNGAELIVVINASPYETMQRFSKDGTKTLHQKIDKRLQHIANIVTSIKIPVIYVNQVGGNDGTIFDGGSFVMHPKNGAYTMPLFEEAIHLIDLDAKYEKSVIQLHHGTYCDNQEKSPPIHKNNFYCPNKPYECSYFTNEEYLVNKQDNFAHLYSALILGLRDFICKCNLPGVIIGISGGIDSALTFAIARDAFPQEMIQTILLPTKHTSNESIQYATQLVGPTLESIEIQDLVDKTYDTLSSKLSDNFRHSTTAENIQARIRGLILMAISNDTNYLLLNTSNKSESAVGYATLYGDMCGGLGVLQDVYKTDVYKLAKWRNKNIPQISVWQNIEVIPETIITRPPTAELRDNQFDIDSLPEYAQLDRLLIKIIEYDYGIQTLLKETAGNNMATDVIQNIYKLVKNTEFKRKQATIGLKVSSREMSTERRYPVVNHYE